MSERTCWPPSDGEFKGRRKKAGLQSSGNPLPVFPCVVGSVTLAAHGLNVRSALTSPSPNFSCSLEKSGQNPEVQSMEQHEPQP